MNTDSELRERIVDILRRPNNKSKNYRSILETERQEKADELLSIIHSHTAKAVKEARIDEMDLLDENTMDGSLLESRLVNKYAKLRKVELSSVDSGKEE